MLLMVLPLWAAFVISQQLGWQMVVGYYAVISVFTYALYWSDKKKAATTQWRVPEAHLHFCELLGGWPAALLAQRFLRHKTKKRSFQWPFWSIIVLHQLVAFDFVNENSVARALYQLVENS